jgi:hypothetical protein
MLKLKFRPRNPSLIIQPQQNKKTAGYNTRTHLDPAQKNNIHGPTARLITALADDGGIGGNA